MVGWGRLPMCGRWLAEIEPGPDLAAVPIPAQAILTNASQVLFDATPWIGPLVVLAVLLHSREAAAWITVASIIAWLAAICVNRSADATETGLLGDNAIILASALQSRRTRFSVFIGAVLLTVILTAAFLWWSVPPTESRMATRGVVTCSPWLRRSSEASRINRMTWY